MCQANNIILRGYPVTPSAGNRKHQNSCGTSYLGDLIQRNQVSGNTFKLTVTFRPPVFKCKLGFTESLSCYYTVFEIYVEPRGSAVTWDPTTFKLRH